MRTDLNSNQWLLTFWGGSWDEHSSFILVLASNCWFNCTHLSSDSYPNQISYRTAKLIETSRWLRLQSNPNRQWCWFPSFVNVHKLSPKSSQQEKGQFAVGNRIRRGWRFRTSDGCLASASRWILFSQLVSREKSAFRTNDRLLSDDSYGQKSDAKNGW